MIYIIYVFFLLFFTFIPFNFLLLPHENEWTEIAALMQ